MDYSYEVELFDRYNGEGHMTQDEFEADAFDALDPYIQNDIQAINSTLERYFSEK